MRIKILCVIALIEINKYVIYLLADTLSVTTVENKTAFLVLGGNKEGTKGL
jgi:hypothetical protein